MAAGENSVFRLLGLVADLGLWFGHDPAVSCSRVHLPKDLTTYARSDCGLENICAMVLLRGNPHLYTHIIPLKGPN